MMLTQFTVSLTRVRGSNVISDLKVAIVKATRHEENPPSQRYINEILTLTSFSHTHVNACIRIIDIRFRKTKNWVVALKTLMLICLLSQEGEAFEKEIFFAMRKGTRLLNMRDFRGSSNAWDYSSFIRMYALYLDEQLEFRMQGYRGRGADCMLHREEEREGGSMVVKATPVSEMKTVAVFSRVHLLMQLLDRFLACRPTGADMVKVYEIFCRISKQFDELDSFYEWCKTLKIMGLFEFPDVKQIQQSKLDMMDEFIRQKAAMLQNKTRGGTTEPKPIPIEQVRKVELEKALPQPKKFTEEKRDEVKEKIKIQEEVDLLNLWEDAPGAEEEGDKLALALFGCYPPTTAPASTTTPWEAFNDSSVDWETALVQSASHLSNQKPSLPNGFDTLTLDGMYQQVPMGQVVASSALVGLGSASSVAERQNVLALPGPSTAMGGIVGFPANADPFAASLAMAPPSYVQMSEIEKKQRLLVEEQLMWQQYAINGMQGQVGAAMVQYPNAYQYVPGGYTQTW